MLRKSFLLLLVTLMTQVLDRHGQVRTIAVAGPPRLQFPLTNGIRRAAFSPNANTYNQLTLLIPPTRYSGNPIISHGGGGWKNHQVEEPCILIDPRDPTRLIMFFSAVDGTDQYGTIRIGRATASIYDPLTWTEYSGNPILSVGAGGAWDNAYIRVDSVVYDAPSDTFYLYYTGHGSGTGVDQIGLATSAGGNGFGFTKYAGNPILTPSGSETWVSQGSVIQDGSNWYMYYSWRGATTLHSIKLATSTDGVTWTKTGTEVWVVGSAGSYDDTYVEWHHVFKLDGKYVFTVECYDGAVWSAGMGYSTTYNGAVVKEQSPIFTKSGVSGAFDQYQVATPALYNLNQKWYLFYQGGNNSDYTQATWDMGMAELK